MNTTHQFRIALQDRTPLIWRRIQVKSNATFLELHMAIQLAMGWTNSHLFEFKNNEAIIGLPNDADNELERKITNASEKLISDFFKEAGDAITYIYDFGDSWKHDVVLEKVISEQKGVKYPLCLAGNMNCPKEDSGGLHGFYEMLQIIQDKAHPEYKETITWLGKDYDPNHFDIDKANKQLSKTPAYLKEMLE